MPIEGRRVRDDAKQVLVNVELAADVLDHDAVALGILDGVVQLQQGLGKPLGNHSDVQGLNGRDGVVYRGARAQQIKGNLVRRDCAVGV